MRKITGLIGRDDLVAEVVREIKKGKHVVLTGSVGIGKSAVLEAALKIIEPRQSEWRQFDQVTEAGDLDGDGSPLPDTPSGNGMVLVYLSDHQAKGQFVQMARRLMETGILKPSSIDLAKQLDRLPPGDIEWASIRRQVNRMSIRDLSGAIISAIYAYQGKVLIAVDDMTQLTPTQQAFWLAIFDHAQVVTCASQRKAGLRKLWWKMKEIGISPLPLDVAKSIVREYIARRGMMIESPELYVGHVVKQAGGNPQAIHDMVDESSKERLVDKRRIREMRHQAGVRYVDFTPVMIVVGAMVVATRYVALGIGDRSLYVMAGIGAALFLSIRFFMFKGAGKANQ